MPISAWCPPPTPRRARATIVAKPSRRIVAALVLLVLAGALVSGLLARRAEAPPASPTGLFGTLPILWGEEESVAGYLDAKPSPHWAVTALGGRGAIVPVDSLANIPRNLPLLLMAQPRPLSPAENVALDAWVRGGGRLLLFADPMLTQHSNFAPGDRRRPQDVVLLSPILRHWGLDLRFDPEQPPGPAKVAFGNVTLPVDLAGYLAPIGMNPSCAIEAYGLIARCHIGGGRVLVVADAALLEPAQGADAAARAQVLRHLIEGLIDPA